jgi:hypothetical protein
MVNMVIADLEMITAAQIAILAMETVTNFQDSWRFQITLPFELVLTCSGASTLVLSQTGKSI